MATGNPKNSKTPSATSNAPIEHKYKEGYTHIAVLLDRSGSMESIRADIVGGFNTFLGEQQQGEGEATLTLVQFDTGNPYEVLQDTQPIGLVPRLSTETFVPRGGTPLLDAMGRLITDVEAKLARLKEKSRPEHVVLAIITDGQENQSCEFNRQQVSGMLKKKEDDGWKIVFLSADLAAINDAVADGVSFARSMAFDKTAKGTFDAMGAFSEKVMALRKSIANDIVFEEKDRAKQGIEKHRPPS